MKKVLFSITIIVCAAVLSAQHKPTDVDYIFSIKYLSTPVISNSSSQIVFTVSEAGLQENKYINSIFIKNLHDGFKLTRLNLPGGNYSQITWAMDDKSIFFISDHNGRGSQLFSHAIGTNKTIELTTFPRSVQRYSIGNNGDKIYFIAEDTLTTAESKRIDDKWDAYFYNENKKFSSLWELDIKTKRYSKLTGAINVRSLSLAPNRNLIALTAASTPYPNDELTTEIYIYDINQKRLRRLTNNAIHERQLVWASDNSYLTFISAANENLEHYYQESIFKVDLNSSVITDLLPSFGFQVLKQILDSLNNRIIFIANTGVTQQFFSLDMNSGIVIPHTNFKGVIKDLSSLSKNNLMILQVTDPYAPDEFYTINTNNWNLKRFYNPNSIIDKNKFPSYQVIDWFSKDGVKVQGILIIPPGWNGKRTYPLIVQLHGGPNSSYQLAFGTWWANYPILLASRGYLVFQPNYRGSTGYGDSFMRSIIGNFFKDGTEDILSGIDFLTQSGIADPDKIGVMGYSAGAHFTNWLITQTDIFKMAISNAGISDWLGLFALSEVPYLRELWMNSNPYDSINTWIAQSPLTYANRIKTPTFFSSGESDTRVPLTQSIEMWRALKRNNIPTKLMVLPREFHSIEELKHQHMKINAELEWIKTYLPN